MSLACVQTRCHHYRLQHSMEINIIHRGYYLCSGSSLRYYIVQIFDKLAIFLVHKFISACMAIVGIRIILLAKPDCNRFQMIKRYGVQAGRFFC
jgi:hypothetical protein